jgi:hypothetical protein
MDAFHLVGYALGCIGLISAVVVIIDWALEWRRLRRIVHWDERTRVDVPPVDDERDSVRRFYRENRRD